MSGLTRKVHTASHVLQFKKEYKRAGAGTNLNPRGVFFVSDTCDALTGNLQCIYDSIGEGYEKQVYCRNKHVHPQTAEDIRQIARGLATCKYVFLDDVLNYTEFMDTVPGQQIIQLWHACGAYKKFGFARPDGETGGVRVSKGHRKYTAAIVSAEEIRGCYAEGFDIPVDRIHATGIPRTDVFFDATYKKQAVERVLSKYPAIADKRKILFAPTYRGTRIADANYDFDQLDPKAFLEALGEEYTLLLKWHPAMAGNLAKGAPYPYERYLDGVTCLDVSDDDITDLMLASDLMITDYSSAIFEYLLTDKPVIYYVYDIEQYAGARGLFFDFEEYLYGETAHDQEELVRAVQAANLMEDRRQQFRDKFMSACDGHATERVRKLIFEE